MSAPVRLEELRTVDLFDELTDAQLEEWLAVSRPVEYEPGEVLAEQGDPMQAVQLLVEGTARTVIVEGDRVEPVGRQRSPTWMGAIAVLTGDPFEVRVQAETPCRAAVIDPEDFRRLVFAHPAVHQRVMRQVAPVMTRLTAIEQNRERLAALGTMAAGLAHELNNPAAAAQSSAAQMVEAVQVVGATLGRFVGAGIERAEAEQLVALHEEALARAAASTGRGALDAADAEDELLAGMEDLDVPEAWRLVEPLAAAGLDQDWLDRVAALAGSATDAALGWVAATLTAQGLAAELQESTRRMSDLVGAVKTYAYMDRGDEVQVDIHEGLDTTLVILNHKLKHTRIEVVRDYDRELPALRVRGSELNQVWTNLLDNAIDALGADGTITVRTRRDGDCAVVEIADDGQGIPAAIQERVFDSFFTTKEVGQGTGLGLAKARSIVVDRHDGSLSFESEPGRTVFRVWLPLGAA